MILLTLDLYGIFPFIQAKRISFKSGFNSIVGKNGSGKTMIYRVISSLLLNTTSEHIAFVKGKTNQASVSFQLENGIIYRIARDYQKGVWNLARILVTTEKFQSIETDRDKILQWMRKETGGLDEDERGLLFMIDDLRLPSQHPRTEDAGVSLSKKTALISNPKTSQEQGLSRESLAEKQEALKEAVKKLDAMTEIDVEMLEKRDDLTAIQKRIAQIREVEQKMTQMEEVEAEKFTLFVVEGVVRQEEFLDFEAAEEEKEIVFLELKEEAQANEAAVILLAKKDAEKDRLFFSGIIIAAISFCLPFVVDLVGLLRYLFLGGLISGCGLSVFAYLKRLKRSAEKKVLKQKSVNLDEKKEQIQKKFEKSHAMILKFLSKMDTNTLSELKKQQEAFTRLREKKEAARGRVKKLLNGERIETLHEKAHLLEEAVQTLGEKLKPSQALSEEVYRLQEALREAETRKTSTEESLFDHLPGLGEGLQVPRNSFVSEILSIGKNGTRPLREQLEVDAESLYRRFQPGGATKINLEESGKISVGETPFRDLSSGSLDQVFLALSLSALAQFPGISFPLLLDAPFSSLDSAATEAAVNMLEMISKKRQIILFTTDPRHLTESNLLELAPETEVAL